MWNLKRAVRIVWVVVRPNPEAGLGSALWGQGRAALCSLPWAAEGIGERRQVWCLSSPLRHSKVKSPVPGYDSCIFCNQQKLNKNQGIARRKVNKNANTFPLRWNKTRYPTSWVQCPQLIPGFTANKTGEMLLVDPGSLRLLFRPRIHERKKIKNPLT